MALIVRPTKTGGNTQYTQEVAAGFKIIRAAEVDADLNLLYQTVNGGLDGANLVDGSVGTAELAANSVTTDKIAPGAVGTTDLQNGAVTNEKLAALAVTSDKIANNSINTGHILDGAVTWNKIPNNSINTDHLVDGSVWWNKIALNSINTNHIVDGAVTGAKIADGTITAADIADGTITAAELAPGAIGAAQIADGSIGYTKLAPGNTTPGVANGQSFNVTLSGEVWQRGLASAAVSPTRVGGIVLVSMGLSGYVTLRTGAVADYVHVQLYCNGTLWVTRKLASGLMGGTAGTGLAPLSYALVAPWFIQAAGSHTFTVDLFSNAAAWADVVDVHLVWFA
jgi:hypothetical protein